MSLLWECLDMRGVMLGVFRGIAPVLLAGWLFSLLPWNKKHSPLPPGFFSRILRGGFLVFIGLSFFLHGVNLGFLPVGRSLGVLLATTWNGFSLIPFGFILGLLVCAAEPTVSVLGQQVEEATSGAVPKKLLVIVLCLGVAVATGLGMTRLVHGWPITWIIGPGYAAIIILSRYCTPSFVTIAYDASTVVTGPMVSSFVVALSLGAAGMLENRSPLVDGFGLVALIAMVPILAVMLVGNLHYRRGHK